MKNLTQRAQGTQRAQRELNRDNAKRSAHSDGRPLDAKDELLFGGFGFCGSDLGSGVGVLFGEALDAAGGVNQLLLAGEEGMAARADFDVQLVALDCRTSLEVMAAGAVHRNGVIVGVNTGFHEAPFCRVRSARLTLTRREEPSSLKG